jgi:hypothetical protein
VGEQVREVPPRKQLADDGDALVALKDVEQARGVPGALQASASGHLGREGGGAVAFFVRVDSPHAPAEEFCRGEVARGAVDGDAHARRGAAAQEFSEHVFREEFLRSGRVLVDDVAAAHLVVRFFIEG